MNRYCRVTPVVLVLLLATGCGNEAVKVYEESSYGPPLEVPPDLTRPQRNPDLIITQLPQQDGASSTAQPLAKVAPDVEGIRLERDGAVRWLSLPGKPEQIWPWVRDFFLDEGFALVVEDMKLGIVETEWKQERNALPPGPRKVKMDDELVPVYGVPVREKYRVRLGRSSDGNATEIWLSHRSAVLEKDDDEILWRLGDSDPELEAAKLRALMIYLGVVQEKAEGMLATATRAPQTSVEKDEQGGVYLKVNQTFNRVWRRVGLALDRMNYKVDDLDRSVGIWYVSSYDPLENKKEKGLFSSDKDVKEVSYRVMLVDESESVSIQLRDDDDKPLPAKVAEPILRELSGWLE